MKWNFKKKGICIIATGLVLSACGGGGSGHSDESKVEEKPTQEDGLYQVYYQAPRVSDHIIEDYFEITNYPIKNNQINFNKSHNEPLDQKILTETKAIEKGTPQSNVVKLLSSTQWLYERTPELKQNLNFQLVKLEGQNIFDRVMPGYRYHFDLTANPDRLDQNLIKFYSTYKNAVFPKGSYCYRLKETQWNQAYLESDFSFSYFSSFNEQKRQIVDLYNGLGEDKKYFKLLDTQWHGYNVIALENLETVETYSRLGNSQNHSTNSQFISGKLWDADKHLAYEKSHPYQGGDTPIDLWMKQNQRLNNAKLENGCFAFNTQAVDAIKKLNLINWKQGDSSDVGQFFGTRTWTYTINE
ncbi:hypothetical protein LF296_06445 [Acinetobacter vivianii]|uniref:Lipoprotein n=1 Tax=Acinetobacter vivianii TaxID=1776742 RepID=A0AAJ6NL91_9GAMM|nr:hypothetical protein [Acinetobacter vivianii]WDZ52410.1 hypothetical protein LF296_06445 [Acinetobacter vivianii]